MTADIPEKNMQELLLFERCHKPLVEACKEALQLLIDEESEMEHELDAHSPDDGRCVVCTLRNVLRMAGELPAEESSQQKKVEVSAPLIPVEKIQKGDVVKYVRFKSGGVRFMHVTASMWSHADMTTEEERRKGEVVSAGMLNIKKNGFQFMERISGSLKTHYVEDDAVVLEKVLGMKEREVYEL